MKYLILCLTLTSCGYKSRHNEAIGQIKKVGQITPLICPEYTELDLSLGVMRNGVGSMSHEDNTFYVPEDLNSKVKQLAESGKPVKIVYSMWRVTWCVPERKLESIEELQ